MSSSFVHPSKQIFSIYAGLTAAGYDMASPSQLVSAIRDANWPDDVLTYFGEARTGGCEVNPYWPRAFLLALASLYLPESPPYRYPDPLVVTRHIESLDSVSPDDTDEDTVALILELPEVYDLLQRQPVLEKLWDLHDGSIDLIRCERVVSEAASEVVERMGVAREDLPRIIVIPNPLQAPEQTDFVTLDDSVYLIKAWPDASSCIHEMLHNLLSPALALAGGEIRKSAHLLRPIFDDMVRLAYAWDESQESWQRVFEEHFIRAAEIWVSCQDNSESSKHATMNAELGFHYVPAMVRQFQTCWSGMEKAEGFIGLCLRTLGS